MANYEQESANFSDVDILDMLEASLEFIGHLQLALNKPPNG